MIHKSIEIKSEEGLHARVASLFVKTCTKFKSDIYIEKDNIQINAKSIMGIIALGALKGDVISVIVNGYDEEEAMKAIEEFLENLE